MVSNRTNMTTLEGVNSYSYNSNNWLTVASYPDAKTQQFFYDPVGNRTNLVEISGVTTNDTNYTYDNANRLNSLLTMDSGLGTTNSMSYAYDAAGRLTNQVVGAQSRTYAYSFRSQMTSLTDTNSTTFSYDFDGDGNRTKQSTSGCLTERFVYDGPNVVLDLNASNQVVHAYVDEPGIDQPIERIAFLSGSPLSAPASRLVYHTDALGSVAAMTDANQSSVKTYAYEAFGKIRSETGSLVINRYTYTAREALGDALGLYYYRWRVMDPNVGRFTSEDPFGFVDGPNKCVYMGNSPLAGIDPLGESGFWQFYLPWLGWQGAVGGAYGNLLRVRVEEACDRLRTAGDPRWSYVIPVLPFQVGAGCILITLDPCYLTCRYHWIWGSCSPGFIPPNVPIPGGPGRYT